MKLAVFIDYDNLLPGHKSAGILDITTRALFRTPLFTPGARGTCHIRVYGGWYEGPTMTKLAQDLSVAVGNEFPSIIRVPSQGGVVALATNAELAVATMEEPSHHLFNTYRKKGKPSNVRVEQPAAVGCTDSACPLPSAKKLLKSGSCPMPSCVVDVRNLVYRHEQKIVDTMLTCDMLYAPTQDYDHLILISGDDDFLPPLRTVLRRGMPVARFHPLANNTRAPLTIRGSQLTDIDL